MRSISHSIELEIRLLLFLLKYEHNTVWLIDSILDDLRVFFGNKENLYLLFKKNPFSKSLFFSRSSHNKRDYPLLHLTIPKKKKKQTEI